MRLWRIQAGLAALALPAAARAITVTEFLGKADALKAKGMMALFSPDMGLLKAEFGAGAHAWRAQAHRPNACPPSGPRKTNSDEIVGYMQAVPPARRATTSASDAIVAGLNRRYPCT